MERKPSHLLRLTAAALLSPLVATLTIGFLLFGDAILLEGIFVGILFIAYPAMIVLGLPAHAILMRWNWRSVFHYAGAGALWGFVIALLLSVLIAPDLGHALEEVTAACAICAGLFWLIRRPDRDPPNPPTSPS